jgi:glycosyltransferase involved in cell wall biosynthesis
MCHATVFINVRSAETPFIEYSFPSKLLEYMAFGRPTITTALPSIPEEYHKFLYLIREENPVYIARLITEVCCKPELELENFGRKARDFVMKEKNYLIQGRRIYDFICAL